VRNATRWCHGQVFKAADLYREVMYSFNACSPFPPSVALAVFQRYGGGAVLDACAGWGCRLLAALAAPCIASYVGVDPNPRLKQVHADVIAFLRTLRPKVVGDKQATVLCAAFEDMAQDDLCRAGQVRGTPPQLFDIMFTSPPFFNREVYDVDPATNQGQSLVRYGACVDAWTTGFLLPLLRGAAAAVKDGGLVALAVANCQGISIVESMLDAVVADPQAFALEPLEVLAFSRSRRCAHKPPRVPQPIFVFRRLARHKTPVT
jgi:tRNA1(Val) A37 N6-methylase TrmN6